VLKVLQSSTNPEELEAACLTICRTADASSLDLLLSFLEDNSFYYRLDSLDDYTFKKARELRLSRIVQAIGKLPPPLANPALVRLSNHKEFLSNSARKLAVIEACGSVRSPSVPLLDFLDALAGAEEGWEPNAAVRVLAEMRSPAACNRIEKVFFSTKDSRRNWFTHYLIQVRDDFAIVVLYRRLLVRGIQDASLRNLAVQTLFDYRLEDWYDVSKPRLPKPPPRREAAPESLRELLKIADLSLKLDLTPDTRESVLNGRKEIEPILKFHDEGHPERIARLIDELNSPTFKVRDSATGALEMYGDWAEPYLRRALAAPPSEEVRQRLNNILAKLPPPKKG